MKVTIEASGQLMITPESGLEAYALGHWAEENLAPLYKQVTAPSVRILIDCSKFPESLKPVFFADGVMQP